ncbi:MAG TPA: hypothetical protein VFV02_14710, partial [Acidimicrobiales bacterium]|nr:hypothetical protein [Acidimicrobiales bacterium]
MKCPRSVLSGGMGGAAARPAPARVPGRTAKSGRLDALSEALLTLGMWERRKARSALPRVANPSKGAADGRP